MTLNTGTLSSLGICSDGQTRFRRLFGESIEVSIDACLLALDRDPDGFCYLARILFPRIRWVPLLAEARIAPAALFCLEAERCSVWKRRGDR